MVSDSPWGSFRSKDMLKIISGDRTLEYVMFVAVTEAIDFPLAVRRKYIEAIIESLEETWVRKKSSTWIPVLWDFLVRIKSEHIVLVVLCTG